jgi:hypothetical protein
LDATPDGKKLYDTLGFKEEFRLTRFQNINFTFTLPLPKINCLPIQASDIKKISAKDFSVFGADRTVILKHLLKNRSDLAWVCKSKNKITGYCFGRSGSNFTQIGPLIADNQKIAEALLMFSLKNSANNNYIIDSLDDQKDWNLFIKSLGFKKQRPFIRMFRGRHDHKGQSKSQYLIAGPELG